VPAATRPWDGIGPDSFGHGADERLKMTAKRRKPADDSDLRLTARAIRPLVSGLRALGHDPSPFLRAAGIEEPVLEDPDARIPMRAALSLLAGAGDATGDHSLGLHLAERAEPGSFDAHFFAMLSSPTLGAGYERLCRWQRLVHETTRVELEVDGERAMLRHRMPGGLAAPRQSAEFLLAAWVRVGRLATGTDWTPLEVCFAHAEPEDTREHTRFFRAPLRFDTGQNALVLPSALLQTPCAGPEPALLALLDRYAADRLDLAPRSGGLADRARAALSAELGVGGEPGASRLAGRLKMSVRTLNRGLAAEGTTYRELLEHLRRERATRYLAEDRVSIAEVAFLLGFSELSSFYRSFKRWTGRTPAEFRNDHRTPGH
jgi:AraC-like DNA-binding protein